MTTRSGRLATAYLSLGSNLGPGVDLVGEAVDRLAASGLVTVAGRAPLYRTTPVGPVPQPDPLPNADATPEVGGRQGLDPVRYGDWEKGGIAVDF